MADNNATIYQCYLTHDILAPSGTALICYPYLFDGLSISAKRETFNNEYEVFLRRALEGPLQFRNVPHKNVFDFDWIYAIETGNRACSDINVEIRRSCDAGQTWEINWWNGKFTTADGKFDLDQCTFEVECDLVDIYSCLLDRASEQFNIISLPTEYTVNDYGPNYTFEFAPYETVDCTSPTPSGFGWIPFWTDCNAGVSTIYIWFREYKWTSCVAGSPVAPTGTWVLDIDDCATTGLARFVRIPIISPPAPQPAEDVVVSDCDLGLPVNPNDSGMGYHTSPYWQLIYDGCGPGLNGFSYWWDNVPPTPTTYTHARNLPDTLAGIIDNACPALANGIYSDFFEINPPGDAPGYSAGINYVTGNANQLLNLMIAQKSDVLDPTASQPATIGNLSFFDIMGALQSMFDVRWWIINNNAVRIEHISYFQSFQQADYTVQPYARQLLGSRIYSRIQEQRPRRQKYKFMESSSVDFVGADIIYDFDCVRSTIGRGGSTDKFNDNSVTFNVDKFTTDIEYITAVPADISKDGFVIFATTPNISGGFDIINEVGLISGNLTQNAHLSWANLHYNYHRYNRVLISGTMNNNPETFFSAKPTIQQDKVIVSDCCGEVDDDVKDSQIVGYITTSLGNGFIDNYKKNLKNNAIDFKLLY